MILEAGAGFCLLCVRMCACMHYFFFNALFYLHIILAGADWAQEMSQNGRHLLLERKEKNREREAVAGDKVEFLRLCGVQLSNGIHVKL